MLLMGLNAFISVSLLLATGFLLWRFAPDYAHDFLDIIERRQRLGQPRVVHIRETRTSPVMDNILAAETRVDKDRLHQDDPAPRAEAAKVIAFDSARISARADRTDGARPMPAPLPRSIRSHQQRAAA